jgi:hypothetical protein
VYEPWGLTEYPTLLLLPAAAAAACPRSDEVYALSVYEPSAELVSTWQVIQQDRQLLESPELAGTRQARHCHVSAPPPPLSPPFADASLTYMGSALRK